MSFGQWLLPGHWLLITAAGCLLATALTTIREPLSVLCVQLFYHGCWLQLGDLLRSG